MNFFHCHDRLVNLESVSLAVIIYMNINHHDYPNTVKTLVFVGGSVVLSVLLVAIDAFTAAVRIFCFIRSCEYYSQSSCLSRIGPENDL